MQERRTGISTAEFVDHTWPIDFVVQPGYRQDLHRQDLIDSWLEHVTPEDIKNIIAHADHPGSDAVEQVANMYGGDSTTMELNLLLLCSLAMDLDLEYERKHTSEEQQVPFMGQPVSHIVRHTLHELKITPHIRKKIHRAGGMKRYASWVFYRVMYHHNESDELLHPKIAYWWSGEWRWSEPHTRSNDFLMYLQTFRQSSLRHMLEHEVDLFLADPKRPIRVI